MHRKPFLDLTFLIHFPSLPTQSLDKAKKDNVCGIPSPPPPNPPKLTFSKHHFKSFSPSSTGVDYVIITPLFLFLSPSLIFFSFPFPLPGRPYPIPIPFKILPSIPFLNTQRALSKIIRTCEEKKNSRPRSLLLFVQPTPTQKKKIAHGETSNR